ncbi:hypothetical protein GCM10011351_26660 [Paraliobacillus quinghaiensis]|uniref:Uncharacterized protein n=1 Tax=Paraliobacillus quinghaiensis TaxID=470815 RepID=A0A917WWG2_9BACI|nr:hypothetical protein [Paraliobacillus quinghaiensis]GGM39162.1 hypothetical protein GCM10011351_26660 [Paraliobacillus quinghaiensis]
MKKIFYIVITLVLFVTTFINLPTLASEKEAKVLKLSSVGSEISYNIGTVVKEDIKNIKNINLNNYDVILANKSFLNDLVVKKQLKAAILSGKHILMYGKDMKESDIFTSLGFENPAELFIGEANVIEKNISEESHETDKYIETRLNSQVEGEEFNTVTFDVIGISMIDLVPHTTVIPTGNSQNEINELINDIIKDAGNNFHEVGGNKSSIAFGPQRTYALTSTPSGSSIIKSYSFYNYAKNPDGTTLLKYQRTGKLYRQTDADSSYNYYWFATSDIITSGDYLYNNGYENDNVYTRNYLSYTDQGVVLEASPQNTNNSWGNINVSLGLQGPSVNWTFSPGGTIDINTGGANGHTYSSWVWDGGGTRAWLPSKFTSETGMEYRIKESDARFYTNSEIDIDIEKDFQIKYNFTQKQTLHINDN